MTLLPALGRQRQVDLREFEASLVNRVSSRTVSKTTERKPDLRWVGGEKKLFRIVVVCTEQTLQGILYMNM